MEKPKPLIVRFYKDQVKFLTKESKRMRMSKAAVVRHYVDGYRIPADASKKVITKEAK